MSERTAYCSQTSKRSSAANCKTSPTALLDRIAKADIPAPKKAPEDMTMREYIHEHLDEILDKVFEGPICEICPHENECVEAFKKGMSVLLPCEVNADVTPENGKKYLAAPATKENIRKMHVAVEAAQ